MIFAPEPSLKTLCLVTILALIYVPITTVTSVYGMNIQQINGTGHNIGTFIVTTMVTILVTWITWFIAEVINSAFDLRKPLELANKTELNLPFRILMIVWLVFKGHSKWTLRSGVWWQILVDSSKELDSKYNGIPTLNSVDSPRTACEYVISAMCMEDRDALPGRFSAHEIRPES